MHELSIAMSLIEVASEEAARLGAARVHALHVRIGPLSGVVKEALAFSFDVASAGTALEGARLEIEEVPVQVYCDACGGERTLPDVQPLRCPACAAPASDVVGGRECLLTALEIEDDAPTYR
jgi:hydrogenase nickel incorporation protein HypA/HybF